MDKGDIWLNYRKKRISLIKTGDEDLECLRNAISKASIETVRKEGGKTLSFALMLLKREDKESYDAFCGINEYITLLRRGEAERSLNEHYAYISSYLMRKEHDGYIRCILRTIHEALLASFSEHKFYDAVRFSTSLIFIRSIRDGNFSSSFESLRASAKESVDSIARSIEDLNAFCPVPCGHSNTELLHIAGRKAAEKAEGRKYSSNADALRRVHVHKSSSSIKAFSLKLKALSPADLGKYYALLLEEIKDRLSGLDRGYEDIFASLDRYIGKVEEKKISKSAFRMKAALLSLKARGKDRDEIRLAKIAAQLYLLTAYPKAEESIVRLLFDFSENNGQKAAEIYSRECSRISSLNT